MLSFMVPLLAVAGTIMTVVLIFLAIQVGVRGVTGRFGLAGESPVWGDTASAFVSLSGEPFFLKKSKVWPEDDSNWGEIIVSNAPDKETSGVELVHFSEEREEALLYMTGRRKGKRGFWVMLLPLVDRIQ